MSLWIDDSELFLYKPYMSNNAPAQIWRCKNMSASVPLKAADFIITKTTLTSRLDLVGASSSWSEQNYKDLLAYIRDKHFLVNCKGEIFVENFPFDDINQTIDPSTVVYLRAADAINMKKFGFLSPPKLPIRKIKYLDSNPVKDAEMMPQSFVDGGPAQVEDPPVICPPVIIQPIKDARPKFDPSWMTDNWESDWVGIYGLKKIEDSSFYRDGDKIEVTRAGFGFGDDNTTNVRRDYFYGVRWLSCVPTDWPGVPFPMMAVAGLGDRLAQARFNPRIWGMFNNNGDWYPIKATDGIPYEGMETERGPPWPPR